jgi:hypothetical protein
MHRGGCIRCSVAAAPATAATQAPAGGARRPPAGGSAGRHGLRPRAGALAVVDISNRWLNTDARPRPCCCLLHTLWAWIGGVKQGRFCFVIDQSFLAALRRCDQAAQALQNVDNSLELACQWLLASASRSDDDGTPGGTRVGAQSHVLP